MKINLFRLAFKLIIIPLCLLFVSSGLLSAQTYTVPSTYTYTVPPGVTKIKVKAWGGGGAGGSRTGNGRNGGGGGGAYSEGVLSVMPGTVYKIVVGAGAQSSGSTSGGISWLGANGAAVGNAILSANGGRSIDGANGSGAAGGATSFGNSLISDFVSFKGGDGGDNSNLRSGGGGGGAGPGSPGGSGSAASTNSAGSSPSGGIGGASVNSNAANNPGNAPGGGGSGTYRNNTSSSAVTGGAGGAGRLEIEIVEELPGYFYFPSKQYIYTVAANVTKIRVHTWGGGGGGGNRSSNGVAGGGAGGGYSAKDITLTEGDPRIFKVVVGAPGLSNINGGDSWVAPGNSSTLVNAAVVLAKGGVSAAQDGSTGGVYPTGNAGTSGFIGDSDKRFRGGNGGAGTTSGSVRTGGGGGAGGTTAQGTAANGISGGTSTGGGIGANGRTDAGEGSEGGVPGGGGSGARKLGDYPAGVVKGGAGGAGHVWIEVLESITEVGAGPHNDPTKLYKYTAPAGVSEIRVKVWGGGGGGLSNSTGGAGGGGGGGYSYKEIPVNQGDVFYFNVGVGGKGSSSSAGNAGPNHGGASWFSRTSAIGASEVSANGGRGVQNNEDEPGNGGSGGGTQQSGESGVDGDTNNTGGRGGKGGGSDGGTGGARAGANGDGNQGSHPGGGGSGARRNSSGNPARTGGDGAAGRVEIEEVAAPIPLTYWGSGSRDLYPEDAKGNRAFLMSGTATTGADVSWPFRTNGDHFVYAKAGEIIALASSAHGYGSGAPIRITDPSGNVTSFSFSTNVGRIGTNTGTNAAAAASRRQEEVAGPRPPGHLAGGDRYLPHYHTALETGVYKVEFLPASPSATVNPATDVAANAGWTQPTDNRYIAAWDVSVWGSSTEGGANDEWKKARVYTNVMNLSISQQWTQAKGFYGKVYPLTKDGWIYRVDNNGSVGVYFTFFVNNKGFYKSATEYIPSYKSLDNTAIGALVQDPRKADTQTGVTHKIFYAVPDSYADWDLPSKEYSEWDTPGNGVPIWNTEESAKGYTWLKTREATMPEVSNVSVVGVEGAPNQVTPKGAYIKFTANIAGNFQIVFKPDPSVPGNQFVSRTIVGSATIGENEKFWDGLDGGTPAKYVLGEDNPVIVSVILQGGEVHFPYIDMEINPAGIYIERLDPNFLPIPGGDMVYWDDSGVTIVGGTSTTAPDPRTNLDGRFSKSNNTGKPEFSGGANGHRWGAYTGSQNSTGTSNYLSFGNERSIDTWTYVADAYATKGTQYKSLLIDLEVVSSIVDDPSFTGSLVDPGDTWSYVSTITNSSAPRRGAQAENHAVAEYGPTDALIPTTGSYFIFVLPEGVEPASGSLLNDVVVEVVGNPYSMVAAGEVPMVLGSTANYFPRSWDPVTRQVKLMLNVPLDAELKVTIPVVATAAAVPGVTLTGHATLLRPHDVTDIDATSPTTTSPTDPFVECQGLPDDPCNNIKEVAGLTVRAAPALSIVKSITNDPDVKLVEGSVVNYKFVVANTGNVNLSTIVLNDPLSGLSAFTGPLGDDGDGILNPEEVWTYTATYTIKPTDMSTGSVVNTASVKGNYAENGGGTTDPVNSNTVTILLRTLLIANDDGLLHPDPDYLFNNQFAAINGKVGKTGVGTVLVNDRFGGIGITSADLKTAINLSGKLQLFVGTTVLTTPVAFAHADDPFAEGVFLNADGSVDVAPETPAGTYSITYKLCEVASPTNCKTAVATAIVYDFDAIADTFGKNPADPADLTAPIRAGGTTTSVLANDKHKGDVPIIGTDPGKVTLSTVQDATIDWTGFTLNSDGTIKIGYGVTPGTYTLKYRICENVEDPHAPDAEDPVCDVATVTIHVAGPANSTYAIDDVNATFKNRPVSGNVLTNDFDVEDDVQTIVGVTGATPKVFTVAGTTLAGVSEPNAGTVVLQANGSYTYTPAVDFTGDVTFAYEVSDGNGATSTATVHIHVLPTKLDGINTVVATDDAVVIKWTDKPVSLNVLANDFDPEKDNFAITVFTDKPTDKGAKVSVVGGEIIYTPNPDFVGEDTFTYTICEVAAPTVCDIATVHVTVLPTGSKVNYTTAVDDMFYYDKGMPVQKNVLGNDFDQEGHAQKVKIHPTKPIVTAKGVTITFDENGDFTYTPSAEFVGSDNFVYTVCDEGNPKACDVATVYLLVGPENTT